MTAVRELDGREGVLTPEEIQAQGDATIARVNEFLGGFDINVPGIYHNGLLTITVGINQHDCAHFAIVELNGFRVALAEKYDRALGTPPYNVAYPSEPTITDLYELRGFSRYGMPLKTIVGVYEDGMSIDTETTRERASHEIGETPNFGSPFPANLMPMPRPVEKETLADLGVKLP